MTIGAVARVAVEVAARCEDRVSGARVWPPRPWRYRGPRVSIEPRGARDERAAAKKGGVRERRALRREGGCNARVCNNNCMVVTSPPKEMCVLSVPCLSTGLCSLRN